MSGETRTASSRAPAASRPEPRSPGPAPRRRRWPIVSVLVVFVTGVLVVAAVFSPILDVETVEVSGIAPERAAAVRRAAGIDVGDPIVTFLPGSVADRVRDLPWVEDARVVRDLPSVVRIEVTPRIPVGWVRVGDVVALVDEESRVLGRALVPPAGVPELLGVGLGGRSTVDVTPPTLAAAAAALGAELRRQLASVTLTDGAVTGQVAGGPELRFGAPDRLATKARVAAAVLATLGGAPVSYVDVGVPAAPVSG